jgi:clostripain
VNKYFFSILLLVLLTSCFDEESQSTEIKVTGLTEKGNWTFMIYMAADNNLEPYLLSDVEEMISLFKEENNYEIILLVDRAGPDVSGSTDEPGPFNQNFSDTRLYKLANNGVKRVDGGSYFPEITLESNYEANTGDVTVLKKFIQFSKNTYPAEKYGLILWNHGAGPKSLDFNEHSYTSKDVGFDSSSNDDSMFIGEISDVLDNSDSVDFLGFDACLMGSVEIAYQFRKSDAHFSADIMVGAPSEEWGEGWNYSYIFERLQTSKTYVSDQVDDTVKEHKNEVIYNPYEMNAAEFGSIVVEEYRDIIESSYGFEQTMTCMNTSLVEEVKLNVDVLSKMLVNKKDVVSAAKFTSIVYFNEYSEYDQVSIPLYDLYSLIDGFKNSVNDDEFLEQIDITLKSIDKFVLFSYADTYSTEYIDFELGKNGVSVFLPFGNDVIRLGDENITHWETQYWYNAETLISEGSYGNLFWCKDNAVKNNNVVENWFELLDSWYDNNNLVDSNNYRY